MRPFVGPVQVGQLVPGGHVGGDIVQIDTARGAVQSGEVLVEHPLADADRLEQLRAGVGGQRGDAHLGHHLEHTLAGGLDEVGLGRITGQPGDDAAVDHVLDGLEGHVRVDRGRAEATSMAMWCTSRASPVSTTRPTWVRVRSRTRWWCTAATDNSDGIGASHSVDSRSESTMMRAPLRMAWLTLARTSSSARRSPGPPRRRRGTGSSPRRPACRACGRGSHGRDRRG